MRFLFGKLFTTGTHRTLSVLYKTATQNLQTFIEIFDREDHSWATS